MITTGLFIILFMLVIYIFVGVVYIRWPQLMFRVFNYPTGSSGNHLTENGVRAYRRQGYGIIGTGLLLLVAFLYFFFVRY